MKRVLISHFYNEAYLLPWWLRHHLAIFDHGVLIDYGSTDESVAICRDLAPGWEVVRSENEHFSAIMCDFEVMKHEQRFSDCWKIALNTTEFLVAPQLDKMERIVSENDLTGVRIPGAIMVDAAPEVLPDPGRALVEQKASGIWEAEFDFKKHAIPGLQFPTRSRLYHRYSIGSYLPGRHATNLPGLCNGAPELAAIWWYGYSPWNEHFKRRKLGIAPRRDQFDRKHGFGVQHEARASELDLRWSRLFGLSRPLVSAPSEARPGSQNATRPNVNA
ncbi:MAG TPA: glycosyltransferase family 2 protein [Hyphomicrobiaceae bacterium]|nr:glycosyltransferase family 2 protein [Hyphomicrobiaceae bacterium]